MTNNNDSTPRILRREMSCTGVTVRRCEVEYPKLEGFKKRATAITLCAAKERKKSFDSE